MDKTDQGFVKRFLPSVGGGGYQMKEVIFLDTTLAVDWDKVFRMKGSLSKTQQCDEIRRVVLGVLVDEQGGRPNAKRGRTRRRWEGSELATFLFKAGKDVKRT